MTEMQSLLQVSGLCAGYSRGDVLRDVSFTLRKGEILCVVGESGCGKSTLLKALMGADDAVHITGGTVTLEGRELTALSRRERQRLGLAVEGRPGQREAVLGEAADEDHIAQNGQGRRGQERRGQRKRLIFIVKFAASGFNWRGGGSAVQCCSVLRVRQGNGRHLVRRGTAAEQRKQQKKPQNKL